MKSCAASTALPAERLHIVYELLRQCCILAGLGDGNRIHGDLIEGRRHGNRLALSGSRWTSSHSHRPRRHRPLPGRPLATTALSSVSFDLMLAWMRWRKSAAESCVGGHELEGGTGIFAHRDGRRGQHQIHAGPPQVGKAIRYARDCPWARSPRGGCARTQTACRQSDPSAGRASSAPGWPRRTRRRAPLATSG